MPEQGERPAPYSGAFIDQLNQDHVSGWAVLQDGVASIDVLVDGRKVAKAEYGLFRADVANHLPHLPEAEHSGFCYLFAPGDLDAARGPLASIQVVCRSKANTTISSEVFQLPTARFSTRYPTSDGDGERLLGLPPSPFPRSVHRALVEFRGERIYGAVDWDGDKMQEAVTDLLFLHARASRETAGLFRYFSFLREMWIRLEFNHRNFPKVNRISTADQKDTYGVATDPSELFVISHHLANLKSRDIKGNLCEFGCFKGFSTASLSVACSRLAMTMDVFDSFEGLPASDSEFYNEGEFKGSFDEVRSNIEEFGDLSAVRFHKGFFSDSIPHYRESQIACMWMDVDLEMSARDVMSLLPRLAPESCLFSDELGPDNFSAGRVVPVPGSPDSVLPPIIEAFSKDGRSIVGDYVCGHTGVFRDEKRGIAVIHAAPLLRLKDALLAD